MVLLRQLGYLRSRHTGWYRQGHCHGSRTVKEDVCHESRQLRRKIDEAEDQYHAERNRLRDESDAYLDSARDSLDMATTKRELLAINWAII